MASSNYIMGGCIGGCVVGIIVSTFGIYIYRSTRDYNGIIVTDDYTTEQLNEQIVKDNHNTGTSLIVIGLIVFGVSLGIMLYKIYNKPKPKMEVKFPDTKDVKNAVNMAKPGIELLGPKYSDMFSKATSQENIDAGKKLYDTAVDIVNQAPPQLKFRFI